MASREAIMTALLGLLQGKVTGINTFSRHITLPTEAKFKNITLPALFLYRLKEVFESPGDALPPRRKLYIALVVVFQNADKSVAGDTIINPILDAIEDAVRPQGASMVPLGTQTLGGLVSNIKIEGDVQIEPGDTDPTGLGGLVVPLTIVLP